MGVSREDVIRENACKYYLHQQILYMNGQKSVWGFGLHRMAEYLLSGQRRLKHYV